MEFYEIPYLNGYGISKQGIIKNLITDKIVTQYDDKRGYNIFRVSGKNYKAHRILGLMFLSNPQNKPIIDHIDGNKKNNNLINLRWATTKENSQNRCIDKRNKTGYTGIRKYEGKRKTSYKVSIANDGNFLYLGSFSTLEEAINKRKEAEEKYHSEFNKEISLLEAKFNNI